MVDHRYAHGQFVDAIYSIVPTSAIITVAITAAEVSDTLSATLRQEDGNAHERERLASSKDPLQCSRLLDRPGT